MKILLVLCVTLCAVVYGNPIPDEKSIDMLRIPLNGDKELDVLTLSNGDSQINERNKRTIGMLRQLFPTLSQVAANDGEQMDANAINEELTRVVREISEQTNALDEQSVTNDKQTDQQTAESQSAQASSDQSSSLDELTLDNEEQDEENRNKRFLNFGFGASGGNSGASSGGGSGSFIFDILRRTADRAARAAGTVYRVVAGTEPLGVIKTASRTTITSERQESTNYSSNGRIPVLVGGNSGTEQGDASANAPDTVDADVSKTPDIGYTEGIPGPVTRLFVLANRGLSNLIQDLILRIAQTSERVVNFKARLITSLI